MLLCSAVLQASVLFGSPLFERHRCDSSLLIFFIDFFHSFNMSCYILVKSCDDVEKNELESLLKYSCVTWLCWSAVTAL